jgi:hypothetical protein
MADQPVTKKEYLNLAKLVDRMVKEFDEEKKVVHAKLDALTKSTNDTRLQKSLSELKKGFDEDHKQLYDVSEVLGDHAKLIDETRRWFVDEKKSVHDSLDALLKRVNELDKKVQK